MAQASDDGTRPVNVHASNVVWVPAQGAVEVAPLWGRPLAAGAGGALVRWPAGTEAIVHAEGAGLRLVVVAGDAATGDTPTAPGSLVSRSSPGAVRL